MRIRSWMAVVLLAAGAACQKGAGGSGKVEGAAAAALASLPKETSVVIGFNLSKFRETKLFPMVQAAVPEEGKTTLTTFKDTCNIDFMNDIESVIIAGGGNM